MQIAVKSEEVGTDCDEDSNDDEEGACDTDGDEDAIEYCDLLGNALACSQWEVNDWVVVYNNNIFPGQIIAIEDGAFKVNCMHECFPGQGRNCFRWPHPRDNRTRYDAKQILCEIMQPEKPTNSRGAIKLADDDFNNAKKMFSGY